MGGGLEPMRGALLSIGLLALAGCASQPGWAPPAARPQTLSDDQLYCRKAALERVQDGVIAGYGDSLLKRIYADTYGDCLSWKPKVRFVGEKS